MSNFLPVNNEENINEKIKLLPTLTEEEKIIKCLQEIIDGINSITTVNIDALQEKLRNVLNSKWPRRAKEKWVECMKTLKALNSLPIAVAGAAPVAAPERVAPATFHQHDGERKESDGPESDGPPEMIAHFPPGIQTRMMASTNELRVWVIDNSGSMSNSDGNGINHDKTKVEAGWERYDELKQTIEFVAEFSNATKSRVKYFLLNDVGNTSEFETGVWTSDSEKEAEMKRVNDIMSSSPRLFTPLIARTTEAIGFIEREKENYEHIYLMIASDGEPNDGDSTDLERILRQVEPSKLHIVVRICTDDKGVNSFWKRFEQNRELRLDTVDDFKGESQEIYNLNDWLNYGLELHRFREWGTDEPLFDFIDEDKDRDGRPFKLSEHQILHFIQILEPAAADLHDLRLLDDWDAAVDIIRNHSGNSEAVVANLRRAKKEDTAYLGRRAALAADKKFIHIGNLKCRLYGFCGGTVHNWAYWTTDDHKLVPLTF
jgi:hypothetical protein